MIEPKLRFKADDGSQFPDWEEHNFGDLYKVCSGYAFKYENYCDSGVALINGQSIQHGWIDDNNMNYLPEAFLQQYEDFALKENDIVLGLNRPITNGKLKIARVPKEYNNSLLYQRAGKIVCKKAVDDDFSYALLAREIFKFTIKEAAGSDQPFISTSKLNKWKIIVPSSEQEQQKIAEFLSTIDTVIEKQKETVSSWEERKKGVMQKLFNQEVRFKDDDGSEFPEWEEKHFSEMYKSIPNKQYQISTKEYKKCGKYKVIDQGKDFIAGYYDDKSKVYGSVPIIVYGDHTTVVKYLDEPFVIGADGTKLLDKISNNFDIKFLYFALNFNNVKQMGYKRHFSALKEISFTIPFSLAEQQKIADCLSTLDEVIEKQKATLAAWEKLKKGLLQQMFV